MILYVENAKDSTHQKKTISTNRFTKAAVYKINMQKTCCTSIHYIEQSKKKLRNNATYNNIKKNKPLKN